MNVRNIISGIEEIENGLPSVFDLFFAGEPVVEINSPRVEKLRIDAPWDSCVLRLFDGRVIEMGASSGREKCQKELSSVNIYNHGGMPNGSSIFRVYPLAEKLTIGEIKKCMKQPGGTLPIIPDYVGSLEEIIKMVGDGVFKSVHGYTLKTIDNMTWTEFQKVGKTPADQKAGIPSPNWRFLKVDTANRDDQTPVELFSPKVIRKEGKTIGFSEGYDPGLLYIGESLWNPDMKEITSIGGRGQATAMQDFAVRNTHEMPIKEINYPLAGVGSFTATVLKAISAMESQNQRAILVLTMTAIKEKRPAGIAVLDILPVK